MLISIIKWEGDEKLFVSYIHVYKFTGEKPGCFQNAPIQGVGITGLVNDSANLLFDRASNHYIFPRFSALGNPLKEITIL